jgi:hypothetical protein
MVGVVSVEGKCVGGRWLSFLLGRLLGGDGQWGLYRVIGRGEGWQAFLESNGDKTLFLTGWQERALFRR